MKPNIIFCCVAQQRFDTLTPDLTPNLWALAEDGTRYINSYTCQSLLGPAKACLQTGKFATQVECFKNNDTFPEAEKTLALYFREEGFEAAIFDDLNLATEYINKKTGSNEKPFFLFVSELNELCQKDNKKTQDTEVVDEKFLNFPLPDDLTFLKGNYKTEYANYISKINQLDFNIGKLVEALKTKELYDNTVIVYTSISGCHFKTRNKTFSNSCHESSIHTPLVISGGAFKRGTVDDRLVSLIDLPPTLLDFADIYIPSYFSGISILEQEEKGTRRENVFVQISETQIGRAIRTEKYKYSIKALKNGRSKKDSKVYYEDYLYDLENDPYEKMNLANDKNFKEIRKNLAKQLSDEMEKAWELKPKIRPAIKNSKK